MKIAGGCRFGGNIDEDVAAVQVAADGTVTQQSYPQSRDLNRDTRRAATPRASVAA